MEQSPRRLSPEEWLVLWAAILLGFVLLALGVHYGIASFVATIALLLVWLWIRHHAPRG